ncbi:AraC-like transcriptional regulator [Leptospira ryugenii]|uniref:AraC-like transcriptional regulator n=1 Tax=Leptospira ryugenii TaxID=1917863 RepID=A0A2P2E4A4_9LEPT|nr:AraC family transcriptional regulator [Leptospira ryugenii]GBF51718.1 AraC-like transcriptional regulator [Leptospira ryugenii]
MDILSDIISQASWKTDLLSKGKLYESWGFRFPCDRSGGFHVITQGSCYVRFSGKDLKLERGDLIFITRGIHHELLSDLNAKVMEIQGFLKEKRQEDPSQKPITTFVSARYEIPIGPVHPFFTELPDYILIPARDIESHHTLSLALTMLSAELEKDLCTDLIVQRLTDIILYNMIRFWMETQIVKEPGWLMALRDPVVIKALEELHKYPSKDWTIATLANCLGISRANLASRFKDVLSIPPMEYLAKLRMERAKVLFKENQRTLEEIALEVGYASAFSFSKAYKRIYGQSPAKEWKKVS